MNRNQLDEMWRDEDLEQPMYPNNRVVLWHICVSLIPSLAAPLLAPENVLSRYGFLREFVSLCSSAIPGIARLATVSSFPEVTKLVLSVSWTLVIVQTIQYLSMGRTPRRFWLRFQNRLQNRLYWTAMVPLLVSIVVGYIQLFDITPEDLKGGMMGERTLRWISGSRFGLGVMAPICMSTIALFIYLVLSWFRDIPWIYFHAKRGGSSS